MPRRNGKEVVTVVVKRGDMEEATVVTFQDGAIQVHMRTDVCFDCGEVVHEHYMVNNSVWCTEAKLHAMRGYLHIACLEKRIGRKLTLGDFTDTTINAALREGWRIGRRIIFDEEAQDGP